MKYIIEAWGTGIPRIINRCKEYGLKEKINSLSGNNRTKENVEKVLLEISVDDVFGRTEIANILGVSDTAARNKYRIIKE